MFMKRRSFLRSACHICMLPAIGLAVGGMEGCLSKNVAVARPESKDGKVSLPVSSFDTDGLKIIQPKGLAYDIAVTKKDENFVALLLMCTHQENQLTALPNGYRCSLHGSMFDQNGDVTKGPAVMPLHHLPVANVNGNLEIDIKRYL